MEKVGVLWERQSKHLQSFARGERSSDNNAFSLPVFSCLSLLLRSYYSKTLWLTAKALSFFYALAPYLWLSTLYSLLATPGTNLAYENEAVFFIYSYIIINSQTIWGKENKAVMLATTTQRIDYFWVELELLSVKQSHPLWLKNKGLRQMGTFWTLQRTVFEYLMLWTFLFFLFFTYLNPKHFKSKISSWKT